MFAFHEPVLVDEVLRFLAGARHVLDGTLGGGGHAAALLELGARVVGVDRDPSARAAAEARLAQHIASGALRIVASTFAESVTGDVLGDERFDGALLDLGVSSHQIDDETRGFTFRTGAPLDMRMGSHGLRADEWLNTEPEHDLAAAFREYGDEPRARRLARIIARRRAVRPLVTSDDFVGAIRATFGARAGAPDFARLFQAVRIAVNDELGELARALPALRYRLVPEGVLVVISYHSGEDRLVKRAFQDWSRACTCPPRQPICNCGGTPLGETLTKRPVESTEAETARNPRARSAKLRAWRAAAAAERAEADG